MDSETREAIKGLKELFNNSITSIKDSIFSMEQKIEAKIDGIVNSFNNQFLHNEDEHQRLLKQSEEHFKSTKENSEKIITIDSKASAAHTRLDKLEDNKKFNIQSWLTVIGILVLIILESI